MQGAYAALFERADYNHNGSEQTLTYAQKITETFDKGLRRLTVSFPGLRPGESQIKEQVKEMLRNHESQISELGSIDIDHLNLRFVDSSISYVQYRID